MLAKKLIMTFGLLLFSFVLADNNVSVDTFEQKITLIYVKSDECKYCKDLDELMHQGEPAKLLDEHFVVNKVNMNELELPDGIPMPYGAPTVYFLDENNQTLIEPIRGMASEEELMVFLEDAILENSELLIAEENASLHQSEEMLYTQLSS